MGLGLPGGLPGPAGSYSPSDSVTGVNSLVVGGRRPCSGAVESPVTGQPCGHASVHIVLTWPGETAGQALPVLGRRLQTRLFQPILEVAAGPEEGRSAHLAEPGEAEQELGSPRERHRGGISQHSNTFQGGVVCHFRVKKYSFLVLLMWRSERSADNPLKYWRRRPSRRAKQAQHMASWRRQASLGPLEPRAPLPRSWGDPYRSWPMSSTAASTST